MDPTHGAAGGSSELRKQLRLLVSNRRSSEARALFEVLCRYVHRRVSIVSRRCGNALAESEQEEAVGDVLLQLMQGSLAAFRGETLPELLGFVRTITDRTTWRIVRRRDRERMLIQAESGLVEDWTASFPRPDANVEVIPDSPLPAADQDYLMELLRAGSKAELARKNNVSRAAVTQRVQRIQTRVAELTAISRSTHEVWLNQAARHVVETEPHLALLDTDQH
jgi:hypothetical protein